MESSVSSTQNGVSNPIEAELVRRLEGNTDVASIADVLAGLWQEIDAVLCPIIGQRGVAALYHRSLHIASRTYPWLANSRASTQASVDLTHLKALFIQQQRSSVIAGAGLLYKTFYELLVSLVGLSLTERLLCSVGAHLFSGQPAQDCS